MIQTYRDLDVYRESYELALKIYKIAFGFPKSEQFLLTDQMIRASRSIPANIAEGWARRNHIKEFQHHLDIATGSCNEMEVHLEFCKDFKYISEKQYEELNLRYHQLGGKLVKLKISWKNYF